MEGWIVFGGMVVFTVMHQLLIRRGRPRARRAPAPPKPNVHETLASVQDGEFVKLTGRIQAATDSLAAALSGRPCIAYLAIARVWHSKAIPQLIADVREARAAPLVLAVHDAEVIIEGPCLMAWPTAAPSPRAPDREAAFLTSHKLERYLASTEFEEAVVHTGERIWVSGVVVHERAGEHGYRDSPLRTRLVTRPQRPLTIGRP